MKQGSVWVVEAVLLLLLEFYSNAQLWPQVLANATSFSFTAHHGCCHSMKLPVFTHTHTRYSTMVSLPWTFTHMISSAWTTFHPLPCFACLAPNCPSKQPRLSPLLGSIPGSSPGQVSTCFVSAPGTCLLYCSYPSVHVFSSSPLQNTQWVCCDRLKNWKFKSREKGQGSKQAMEVWSSGNF